MFLGIFSDSRIRDDQVDIIDDSDDHETPVIESVFLPAHAATSGSTITNLQLQIVNGDTTTDSVDVRITGSVVPATSGTTVNLTLTPST